MKTIKTLLIFLGFISTLCLPQVLKATHTPGFTVLFDHVSGASYDVYLYVYRDCGGITEGPTQTVNFTCPNNPALNFSAVANKISTTTYQQYYSNPAHSTCNGGQIFGIQLYIYKVNVTLAPANKWIASFGYCCRNPASNTVGTGAIYIEGVTNTLIQNSSPTFTSPMNYLIPSGQVTNIDMGAYDVDGDSLSHSLYPIMTQSNGTLPFVAPFTYQNFIGSSIPITLDHHTGILTLKPTMTTSFQYGVKTEEWRMINGVQTHIGTVYRDYYCYSHFSNNVKPWLGGIDTANTHTYGASHPNHITVKPGDSLNFDITALDSNSIFNLTDPLMSALTYSWDTALPGATWYAINQGTQSAYANIQWTAPMVNTPTDYTFKVNVQDSASPFVGLNYRWYTITVFPSIEDIGVTKVFYPNTTIHPYVNPIVMIQVKNHGTEDIDSIPLSYVMNNGITVQESVTNLILHPGDTLNYVFTNAISNPGNDFTLKTYTTLPNDANRTNDTILTQVIVSDIANNEANEFMVFQNAPNPSRGFTNIKFNLPQTGTFDFKLYDINGRLIKHTSKIGRQGSNSLKINTSRHTPGTYTYTIQYGQQIFHKKLIIQ